MAAATESKGRFKPTTDVPLPPEARSITDMLKDYEREEYSKGHYIGASAYYADLAVKDECCSSCSRSKRVCFFFIVITIIVAALTFLSITKHSLVAKSFVFV